ncbi:MAG TPA: saccharopine dehydrogenase C-terminal domain-containing protein [Longimicrobiales bacterium]|nr:saccharopine dehydrogenase C-terminal domain-containing protein [Longimicrobiales bacterium]
MRFPPGARRRPLRIVVLGGGRVGGAIVRDLAAEEDFSVLVVDVDPVRVERLTDFGADGVIADLSTPKNVAKAVADADLVVGAVPGFLGYRTVACVLDAGRPIVDISFFPEDAFGLEPLARSAGVPCFFDCGIAPGLGNLVLGRLEEELDETYSFQCLVGGLPVERTWPWEYKALFSPGDVIEEYVRPARMRRGGVEVTMPALSEVELVHFPGLGSLEAFNTDGLRSLLRTARTPNMVEKTLRYPGHAVRMRILREAGFFSTHEIQAASGAVRPRDVTEALLFSAWHFEEGEPDLTVMRIVVEGVKDGKRLRYTYTRLDYYTTDTETSSMARTTGYTCTAMVRLIAKGLWTEPGLVPPEVVGRDAECFDSVLAHLRARGVHLFQRVDELDEKPTRSKTRDTVAVE